MQFQALFFLKGSLKRDTSRFIFYPSCHSVWYRLTSGNNSLWVSYISTYLRSEASDRLCSGLYICIIYIYATNCPSLQEWENVFFQNGGKACCLIEKAWFLFSAVSPAPDTTEVMKSFVTDPRITRSLPAPYKTVAVRYVHLKQIRFQLLYSWFC